MNYVKKFFNIIDNYVLARYQHRASTAYFWYLPETANICDSQDLLRYQQSSVAPFYFMDYRQKLKFPLTNDNNIIVLPYDQPIGKQINPEAAFQFALGLHDKFMIERDPIYLEKFFHYADYFLTNQTADGCWNYYFDWFMSKAPWHSALAQARGASVMLRAFLHTKDSRYQEAASKAVSKFLIPTTEGGFLQPFSRENCAYYEEYPKHPTGVINGFMASLISIWELHYWLKEPWLADLWQRGIDSLHLMLPHYSIKWWSLYDLDAMTPVINVNSPRYHLLEIEYLKILSILSKSRQFAQEYKKCIKQYRNLFFRIRALKMKMIRKIIYK